MIFMEITYQDLSDELHLVRFLSLDEGIYAMDKNSLLYKGVAYWGHRYHYIPRDHWDIVYETADYIWIKGPIPYSAHDFGYWILRNKVKRHQFGYVVPKFIKYLRRRKTFFTPHIFDNIHTLSLQDTIPFPITHKQYRQIKLNGLIYNMKKGLVQIDYNHLPKLMQPFYNATDYSKGMVLYKLAMDFPCLYVDRYSLLWKWILKWYQAHGKNYKDIYGLHYTKHYALFGCANIKFWKPAKGRHPRHPRRYSGVDYFVFHGDSSGVKARKFIKWLRSYKVFNLPKKNCMPRSRNKKQKLALEH